jgi:hypothetical protein
MGFATGVGVVASTAFVAFSLVIMEMTPVV